MSNITGGELSYVITVDTKQLKTQLKDGEKTLMGFNDVAEKAGESLDKMVDGNILNNLKSMGIEIGKTGAEINKAFKDADIVISQMEMGLQAVIAENEKLKNSIEKSISSDRSKDVAREEYRLTAVEIEKTSQTIEKLKQFIEQAREESKTFSERLRDVTNEMKVLYDRGEENSQRYQELTQKAAEYKTAQDAVNKQVQIASGPQGFNGLINTLTFAAGGFSAAQGAMGLFGGESEDLNKIMLKVQSSLALVVGLQEIQKQVSAEGAFNITVLSRIKQIWAATNLRVSTTLGITNVQAQALTAGLTLGLSVAVIAIIALFQKWQTESDKLAEKNKQITSSLADSVAEPLYQYKRLQLQWNNLGDDLNKKKKFIDENKDSFNKLGVEVGNVSEAERILVSESDTFIEMMMLRAEAAAYAQSAMESFKKSLELRGEANEKLKNPTIGQNIGAFWQMGVMGKSTDEYIAGAYQESDAEKQKALDFTTKQVERMQKAYEIANKKGWKKSDGKKGKTKNPKEVADEYLPEGSVAEIQRRLSKIDEALSKATGKDQISKLKTERINTAIELAKAEKLIQIQSITEQVNENEKLWKQYYSAVISIGKNPADEIYKDLISESKNHISFLEKKKEELTKKSELKDKKGNPLITEQEKEDLKFLTDKINELSGVKSPFEKLKEDIDDNISKIPNLSEQLKYLNETQEKLFQKEGNSLYFLEANNEIEKRKSDIAKEIENSYQEFLAAHQSFEEKKNAITKNYAELRQKIEADTTLNNEQKKNALEKAAQEEADAYSDAFMNELLNNPQYREAFADLDRQTTERLKKLRAELKKYLSETKNLNPEAQARIRQEIENLDRVIGERNPYQKLKNLIEQLGDESISTSQKMKLINEAADTVTGYINDVKGVVSDVTGALDDLGIEMSDSSKDLVSSINQTLEGFGQMAEGTKQFAEGYLSGDPIKMVAGTIKYISGAIKTITAWTNGDKKKERQIKAWADQVANLKVQYQELERAMNKALGDDKYKNQQEQIANLERQKILLQQMIKKEEDKKKTDKGKIKDWQQQISDINNQISDIKDNIVNDILQIDVKGLADKIGDALIEGFGRGEDALQSLNKTADEIFKDMVKNALKMQLEKNLQPVLSDMLKAMGYTTDSKGNPTGSFDGLTPEEREALKAQIIAATGDYQKAMEQYADLFGPDAANSPNGLKGDIKGITEKTAGALEGQINAIRIYQVESLNTQKANQNLLADNLKYNMETAINTRDLKYIRQDIAELNSKVKKPLAGLDN